MTIIKVNNCMPDNNNNNCHSHSIFLIFSVEFLQWCKNSTEMTGATCGWFGRHCTCLFVFCFFRMLLISNQPTIPQGQRLLCYEWLMFFPTEEVRMLETVSTNNNLFTESFIFSDVVSQICSSPELRTWFTLMTSSEPTFIYSIRLEWRTV